MPGSNFSAISPGAFPDDDINRTSTNNGSNNEINATEQDAVNCYIYQTNINSRKTNASSCCGTFFGHRLPFQGQVQLHYQNFRIGNVSWLHSVIWVSLFVLYFFGMYVTFTEYDEGLWFMRIILSLRLAIAVMALFNFHSIFYSKVTHESSNKEEFRFFVNRVTALSNFIVVSVALVNGAAYMWTSSKGSCLYLDPQTLKYEVRNSDTYFYDCNSSFETGGTPVNSMVLLLLGNIFIVTTLPCHSSWAARINYFVTCFSCITAAALSPDPGQSTLIILSAFLSIVVYENIEANSLAVFKALLNLEYNKRVGVKELKHFIGNVAHDLKVPSY
jgi:hypothetical protein